MKQALALACLVGAGATLILWVLAAAAASQSPPPVVRVFGEGAWLRVSAYDTVNKRIVKVEGEVEGARLRDGHATVERDSFVIDATADGHPVSLAVERAPCVPARLEWSPWREALLTTAPDAAPVYPEAGLAPASGNSRVLVGDEVITVAKNAAGPALPDGRLLRVARGAPPLQVEPLEDGWRATLPEPGFFEVRRDGCIAEMTAGTELIVTREHSRWVTVHAYARRYGGQAATRHLVFDLPELTRLAGEDPLAQALARGERLSWAPFAAARAAWTRGRAPRMGPSDAAQLGAWRARRADRALRWRWAMRGAGGLAVALGMAWAFAGARPGRGQASGVAVGLILLPLALAVLGALDWAVSLVAR